MRESELRAWSVAYLTAAQQAIGTIDWESLDRCRAILCRAWTHDRTVLTIGNGGSASTAAHLAADLAGQVLARTGRPLRALALGENTTLVTALANDSGYADVFADQIRRYTRRGDVLIAISCSGESPNVVRAVEEANARGLTVISMSGPSGGRIGSSSAALLKVATHDFGQIESVHVLLSHLLVEQVVRSVSTTGWPRPAILVDRDGVINHDRPGYVRERSMMTLIPGAIEALAHASMAGHRVLVLTNQPGIGKGLVAQDVVDEMHAWLAGLVRARGGCLEAFLVCPHAPEAGCGCRKPAPGLLYRARDEFGVDLAASVMIGDHDADVVAARRAGCRAILVASGRLSEAQVRQRAVPCAPSLAEAVRTILDEGLIVVRSASRAAEQAR